MNFLKSLFLLVVVATSSIFASNLIEEYEQKGDYANALTLAQHLCEKNPNCPLDLLHRLEKELLTLGYSRLLFDAEGKPRETLISLLELLGMPPLNESESALAQINHFAQDNLLRKGERWEKQANHHEELKPQILPLLSELGFVNARNPHFKEYEGAIVHGALLQVVRLRLYTLVNAWKQGVRFSDLYFLTGERFLEPTYENSITFSSDESSLLKIRKKWNPPKIWPKTEYEMIQLVWDQSEIPHEMRQQIKVHFINAPARSDLKSHSLVRPNTNDTVNAWLRTFPSYGNYLAVSNAPYINRQDLAIRTLAPKEYGFETIGPSARKDETLTIFLDELARFIFQQAQP